MPSEMGVAPRYAPFTLFTLFTLLHCLHTVKTALHCMPTYIYVLLGKVRMLLIYWNELISFPAKCWRATSPVYILAAVLQWKEVVALYTVFFVRGVQGAQSEKKIMQNRWSRYHIPLSMLSSPQPRLLPLRAHKGLPAVWSPAPKQPARQPGLPHSIQPERGWGWIWNGESETRRLIYGREYPAPSSHLGLETV